MIAFVTLLLLLPRRSHGSCVYRLQQQARKGKIVYNVTVRGERNDVLGRLEVREFEEAADAVYLLGLQHDVGSVGRRQLTETACGVLSCSRTTALLYENAVVTTKRVTLQIWEGQAPEDAVADWARTANADPVSVERLTDEICGPLAGLWTCRTVKRRIPVTVDESQLVFEIFSDDEAADAAFRFMARHGLQNSKAELLKLARQNGAKYSRETALLFSAMPIRHLNGSIVGGEVPRRLDIYEGTEPADAAWTFFRDDPRAARQLADEICGDVQQELLPPRQRPLVKCVRRRAIVRQIPVRGPFGEDKKEILVGVLDVVDEAEAYDLAYSFSAARGCDGCDFYRRLAASLCAQGLQCSRRTAIAYRRHLNGDDLASFGWPRKDKDLIVWEDEEIVDGVRRLWFEEEGNDHQREPRRALAAALCRQKDVPRSLCSRAEEVVARARVQKPSAVKTMTFNLTRPRRDDALCAQHGDCGPTVFDWGVEAWGGADDLQVLAVRNDSEADRRGVIRGMKALTLDGHPLLNGTELQAQIRRKAAETNVTADIEFLVVDESERYYPTPIQVFEDQTPSDAVYEFCKTHELLQPNYTIAGVQETFLATVCNAPTTSGPVANCEKYEPRTAVFDLQLTRDGLGHTFRYYAEDWPPCPDEYRPMHLTTSQLGTTWPFGRNSEDLVVQNSSSCESASLRAARSFCDRLGKPEPENCVADLSSVMASRLKTAAKDRWNDKATPDGPELYAVLGVPRDADNDTIVAAYTTLATELRKPYEALMSEKRHAEALTKQAEQARIAARALLRRAGDTVAAARDRLRHESAVITTHRDDVLHRLNSTSQHRGHLEALFGTSAETGTMSGVVPLDDVDGAALESLRAEGLVAVSNGAVDLTSLGKRELEGALEWPTLAVTIGETRGGGLLPLAMAVLDVVDAARRRTDLARDILRRAKDAATGANETMTLIEAPIADLASRAFALDHAFETLTDPVNRDFYDRPCRPVFGACCVRDAPDGGLRITCGT